MVPGSPTSISPQGRVHTGSGLGLGLSGARRLSQDFKSPRAWLGYAHCHRPMEVRGRDQHSGATDVAEARRRAADRAANSGRRRHDRARRDALTEAATNLLKHAGARILIVPARRADVRAAGARIDTGDGITNVPPSSATDTRPREPRPGLGDLARRRPASTSTPARPRHRDGATIYRKRSAAVDRRLSVEMAGEFQCGDGWACGQRVS